MDTQEHSIETKQDQIKYQEIVDALKKRQVSNIASFSSKNTHPLTDILHQRKEQRDKVLTSIMRLLWASFFLLAGLLMLQAVMRVFSFSKFNIVDDSVIQVLAISVFGQVISVVVTISLSLWNDKIYIESIKNL